MTNVDMIFESCASIEIKDGARIRANNSVFRPCAEADVWQGLNFSYNSNDNIFDECVFKNAQIALNFDGSNGTCDGRINNNYFQNCKASIRLNFTEFKNPITGNNFVLDQNYKEQFYNCINPSFTSNIGIVLNASSLFSDVNHNNFSNSSESKYIGIGINESQISRINNDNFNNLFQSCYFNSTMLNADSMSFFDNHINNNNDNNFVSQVLVQSCQSIIQIENNTIKSKIISITPQHAIEILNANLSIINANNIFGYSSAIVLNGSNFVYVLNNKIENSISEGIHINNSTNISIKCNEINMNHRENGVGIYMDFDRDIDIESNCIVNTNYSIFIDQMQGTLSDNIHIYNNYFYNYSIAGVSNFGCLNLEIGLSSGVNGQNTFYSNGGPTVLDIYSNPPNMSYSHNNFGVWNYNWPQVVITASQPIHSTASCGHQIFGQPSQGSYDNEKYNCDNDELLELSFPLAASIFDNSDKTDNNIVYILNLLKGNNSEIDLFYNYALNKNELSESNQHWLSYYYHILNNNYRLALDEIKKIIPITESEKEITEFLKILLELKINKINYDNIDSINLNRLLDISYNLSNISNSYNTFVNLNKNSKDIFVTPLNRINREFMLQQMMDYTKSSLLVFPNPAKDVINVFLNSEEAEGDIKIQITDIMGRLIKTQKINFVAGACTLDISSFSNGTYILSVTGKKSTQVAKFVKN